MVKAFDSEFYKENGKLLGINLGADFTSEHEWGIKGIQNAFQLPIDNSILGIQKRMVSVVPKNLVYKDVEIDNKPYHLLALLPKWIFENWLGEAKEYSEQKTEQMIQTLIKGELYPHNGLNCAWDERTFGILVSHNFEEDLNTLYRAFLINDIAIGIAPGQFLKNGGLKFTIASRLPKAVVDEIYNNDADAVLLKATAQATGIHEILKKAGKEYFALSPRWKDQKKKEVIFWLNPQQQHLYNFGWYTVEELKLWAEDKGSIIINK